jgi:hypothetical protein
VRKGGKGEEREMNKTKIKLRHKSENGQKRKSEMNKGREKRKQGKARVAE